MKQNLLFEPEISESGNKPAKPPEKARARATALLEQYKEFFELFDESDLPNDDLRLVSDILGPEIAFLLAAELGGLQLNIPKSGLKRLHEKYIKKYFDGSNAKALSIKCRVSQAFVYTSLK